MTLKKDKKKIFKEEIRVLSGYYFPKPYAYQAEVPSNCIVSINTWSIQSTTEIAST